MNTKKQHESDNLIKCPFCHTESARGILVCKGCQAEVKYGTSWKVVFIIFILFLIGSPILGEKIFLKGSVLSEILTFVTWAFGLFIIFNYIKSSKNNVKFKRIMKT